VSVHPGGIRTNIERAGRRCRAAGDAEARSSALIETLLTTPPEDWLPRS
jgi:hypothetical protein